MTDGVWSAYGELSLSMMATIGAALPPGGVTVALKELATSLIGEVGGLAEMVPLVGSTLAFVLENGGGATPDEAKLASECRSGPDTAPATGASGHVPADLLLPDNRFSHLLGGAMAALEQEDVPIVGGRTLAAVMRDSRSWYRDATEQRYTAEEPPRELPAWWRERFGRVRRSIRDARGNREGDGGVWQWPELMDLLLWARRNGLSASYWTALLLAYSAEKNARIHAAIFASGGNPFTADDLRETQRRCAYHDRRGVRMGIALAEQWSRATDPTYATERAKLLESVEAAKKKLAARRLLGSAAAIKVRPRIRSGVEIMPKAPRIRAATAAQGGTILWVGPVRAGTMAALPLPPGWDVLTINQTPSGKTGSMAFGEFAADLGASPLDAIGAASRVIVVAFSAGHGFTEEVYKRHAGDGRIIGAVAADAYYLSDAAAQSGARKEGHAKQLAIAAQSGDPFWFTTSDNGGPGYVSSAAAVALLGQWTTTAPIAEMPAPRATRAIGEGARWFDYGGTGEASHVRHATELAPTILRAWLAGWGDAPSDGGGNGGGGAAVGLGLAAILAAAL